MSKTIKIIKNTIETREFEMCREVLTETLWETGVLFYALKINLTMLWVEKSRGKSENKEMAWTVDLNLWKNIIIDVLTGQDLIEMAYMIIGEHEKDGERSKKGYPYIKW